jgi:hypothetical protein
MKKKQGKGRRKQLRKGNWWGLEGKEEQKAEWKGSREER